MQTFLSHLDTLLFNISSKNLTAYICLDSNINIQNISNSHPHFQYLSTVNDNSFLPCIEKVTRIHNQSSSLIDHILTNNPAPEILSGVIVSDISDHFPVFIELPANRTKNKAKVQISRNFSKYNMENFRKNLCCLDWKSVMDSDAVDTAYEHFWDSFQAFYNLNFPEVKKKFNRNYHKINGYMTLGLLTSRRTKLNLLKKSINEPTNENVKAYKNFRNIYTKTLRASRKLYFDVNFQNAKKIQRKLGI